MKAVFTKLGLRLADRPPLLTGSLSASPIPASSSLLFEWLALTHWKFATQMYSLSPSQPSHAGPTFGVLLEPASLWGAFFFQLKPRDPRHNRDH